MKQPVVTIIAEYSIPEFRSKALAFTKEELDKRIKRILTQELGVQIEKIMDELPISYTVESHSRLQVPADMHTMRCNLISDEELARLRDCEDILNRYHFRSFYHKPEDAIAPCLTCTEEEQRWRYVKSV